MNVYHRKLFALLHDPQLKALYEIKDGKGPWEHLQCLQECRQELLDWWDRKPGPGAQADWVAAASDRLNFPKKGPYANAEQNAEGIASEVCHPISAQKKTVRLSGQFDKQRLMELEQKVIPQSICEEKDARKVFWWFWRFYPELLAAEPSLQQADVLILPAETRLPDCPVHTHNATVAALAGAIFPEKWQSGPPDAHPYLVLFSFSPVQEFIKSSRKFLDFWAGSYLLHYLSARLCWHVAQQYGPDAVITPSLWGQEIIDTLLYQEFPEFAEYFRRIDAHGLDPVERYSEAKTNSLTTAGFPNIIVALAPGKQAAADLAGQLKEELAALWQTTGHNVRDAIKSRILAKLQSATERDRLWRMLVAEGGIDAQDPQLRRQFDNWQRPSCWEWSKLWDAQLERTWDSYWVAMPLGDANQPLTSNRNNSGWIAAQQSFARTDRKDGQIPTPAEQSAYYYLNVGTWWGSLQQRLGQALQALKNTRAWQIPAAPGERSTISGLYSAVHPNFNYNEKFREGGGLGAGTMNLFWRLLALVYPGLFNGSERLNAIELTKRMAWTYGGVAKALGVDQEDDGRERGEIDYEKLIRFPNLSSIAAARFAAQYPERLRIYWQQLHTRVAEHFADKLETFRARTQRPFQVPGADRAMGTDCYNGVMFSGGWLADDMGLLQGDALKLSGLVDEAHRASGFAAGSPADWWVLIKADGDNMGKYINGSKLLRYDKYVVQSVADELRKSAQAQAWSNVLKTRKRMGPATHVGLNRALIDFSNRLVPYLVEERFCGRVIYSGGDDVMAALPLEDLPEFLLSLRAAWSGGEDPQGAFMSEGGYWFPLQGLPGQGLPGLSRRSYFTMGQQATMSTGIVIAHKSVPLPTVLENLWEAEKERAKKLPNKDGLCFRVIFGSGNRLEALMKGTLLVGWWQFMRLACDSEFSPVLYRLAEELPKHAQIALVREAADALLRRRELAGTEAFKAITEPLLNWLQQWEDWAASPFSQPDDDDDYRSTANSSSMGYTMEDLTNLLRFSAFWLDRMQQRRQWTDIAQGRPAEVR
ncbi:type III-B CRISPR-associated protein Cas10/Cmr2 [Gloeobacter morelensis]|uniref:Type III-B CRISPR-associated protein Cas10/Cmr2 n=1 Tax=Gloeobacter morelensis MG652769 TaxID=2781736 RepID=A0ABY3PLV7_9CYAN|nr:type III-B CRISPR-associated protein Cas10/Cmr2 [Gloeobacter morelensis]UFP94661.1 type III-B CRISPR-associated protein Cas10/Cmr2 [Gloeobacter morelensis MG652769]